MGFLKLLLLENFKSWRGRQSIGPFMRFNCIIGPNGSGKSNIMDALSFVMGERTANLRVKSVQELIHGAHIGKPFSSTASVKIVYCEENGEEKTFSRIIRGSCSEFLFNDKAVSRSVYTAELEKIGIIVKARNCMVFQGAVESIAMKKPKERTQLFEQISNSWEFAEEYERKKKKMQQAEGDAQFNYNKKKHVAVERKHAKLEKEEAERYQMLLEELKENRIQLQLFRLYHNEKKIDFLNNKLDEKNMDVNTKEDSLSSAEDTFKAKKKVLGMLNRDQQHMEKEMKTLEASLNQKRPQYIKAKENTSHQIKKVDLAKKSLKDNEKHLAKQEQNIKELDTELTDVERSWRAYEKKVEEEMLQRRADVELEASQLDRYKELKELARKKVATLTQQLEKLQWEQKADLERMTFDERKQKEIETPYHGKHGARSAHRHRCCHVLGAVVSRRYSRTANCRHPPLPLQLCSPADAIPQQAWSPLSESIKQVVEQIEDHKKRIEKLEEYTKSCTCIFKCKKHYISELKSPSSLLQLGTEAESTEATADIYERERAIQIDYSSLTDDLTDLQSDKEIEAHLTRLQQQIVSKENVLFKTAAPNLRALEKLQTAKDKFQESVDAFETSRREARICRQEFEQMKKRRYERFSQCFEHVSVAIDQIYKKLCRNSCAQAFLSPENPEEPYLEGISYNCVAPGKRFMPMDNLSGGEKSVAALALVFAIHSFRPAPFFILDEVDAALDNTNIGKVSSFIKEQAQEQCQMIVISLKEEFYSRADALIGVCPEQDDYMFSQVLTLDLTVYPDIDDSERKEKHRYSSTLE
nr:structural maintenance of chromosomes protein 1B [Chrysemys picta bellii]